MCLTWINLQLQLVTVVKKLMTMKLVSGLRVSSEK